MPLDVETILASVKKTGRLLVVDEDYAMCGVGAEIAAIVVEEAFDELDSPIGRLHTEPVTHPFSPVLEDAVTASAEKIIAAARAVIEGRPPVQRRAAGTMPKIAAFLCSNEAEFIIGQTIVADGGTTSLMSLISDFRNESSARFGIGYLPGI